MNFLDLIIILTSPSNFIYYKTCRRDYWISRNIRIHFIEYPSFNRILSGYNQIIFSIAINELIDSYLNYKNKLSDYAKSEVNKIKLKCKFFYEKESFV